MTSSHPGGKHEDLGLGGRAAREPRSACPIWAGDTMEVPQTTLPDLTSMTGAVSLELQAALWLACSSSAGLRVDGPGLSSSWCQELKGNRLPFILSKLKLGGSQGIDRCSCDSYSRLTLSSEIVILCPGQSCSKGNKLLHPHSQLIHSFASSKIYVPCNLIIYMEINTIWCLCVCVCVSVCVQFTMCWPEQWWPDCAVMMRVWGMWVGIRTKTASWAVQ